MKLAVQAENDRAIGIINEQCLKDGVRVQVLVGPRWISGANVKGIG